MKYIMYSKKCFSHMHKQFLSFLQIKKTKHMYNFSLIESQDIEILNLLNLNKQAESCKYGFILFCINNVINNSYQTYHLDVKNYNIRALSLYYWFGYQIIRQRAKLYTINQVDGITLINSFNKSLNSSRRFLILI